MRIDHATALQNHSTAELRPTELGAGGFPQPPESSFIPIHPARGLPRDQSRDPLRWKPSPNRSDSAERSRKTRTEPACAQRMQLLLPAAYLLIEPVRARKR